MESMASLAIRRVRRRRTSTSAAFTWGRQPLGVHPLQERQTTRTTVIIITMLIIIVVVSIATISCRSSSLLLSLYFFRLLLLLLLARFLLLLLAHQGALGGQRGQEPDGSCRHPPYALPRMAWTGLRRLEPQLLQLRAKARSVLFLSL